MQGVLKMHANDFSKTCMLFKSQEKIKLIFSEYSLSISNHTSCVTNSTLLVKQTVFNIKKLIWAVEKIQQNYLQTSDLFAEFHIAGAWQRILHLTWEWNGYLCQPTLKAIFWQKNFHCCHFSNNLFIYFSETREDSNTGLKTMYKLLM